MDFSPGVIPGGYGIDLTPGIAMRDAPKDGQFHLPHSVDQGLFVICTDNATMIKVYSNGWAGGKDEPMNTTLPLLMLQIPAIILVSKLLYFILRPLRQPRIVCDILGGIVFGPSVLGKIRFFELLFFPRKQILVVRTLAAYGLMYYLFLMGVKMDPTIVLKSGRRPVLVGVCSVAAPLALVYELCRRYKDIISPSLVKQQYLFFLGASISVTAFPVVGDVLADLRILNTELGRLGMSSALINTVFGWVFMAAFTAVNQAQYEAVTPWYAMLSLVAMVAFIVGVLGPALRWIVRQTPKGTRVRDAYVFAILIGVMALGFLGDIIGASFVDGPVILGLVVPDGPPLGSAIVEKVELIVTELLLPLLFFAAGNIGDLPQHNSSVPQLDDWHNLMGLVLVVLAGYAAKLVATTLSACTFRIPFRKAAILGLMMSFRGVVEILTFFYMKVGRLLDSKEFMVLLVLTALSSAVAAPLVSLLYDPLASDKKAAGQRTIQHLRPHTEAIILACVQNEDPVPAIINLIEASSGSEENPVCVFALHLVELLGRASSNLISHRNRKGFINPANMDRLLNAFINYEQERKGQVAVFPYTAVAPYRSMHQDICSLATEKRAVLIIFPFPRKDPTTVPTNADLAMRTIVPEILALAPCSVGILIHGSLGPVLPTPGKFQQNVGVLFWGGPDDREALAYASHMSLHPGVSLAVTRFVPPTDAKSEEERELDEAAVEGFKAARSGNAQVVFTDVAARDMEHTVSMIRSIDNEYDLLVVGRKQGPACLLNEGLADWSECPELGVVGDMFASSDFNSAFSVLIVHQFGSAPSADVATNDW